MSTAEQLPPGVEAEQRPAEDVKREKKKKRKRKRSRSRSRDRKKNPEEYTLRGRRRRRPRYWDMTPEEAHKLGLAMNHPPSITGRGGSAIQPSRRLGDAKIYCGFGALNFNPSEDELKTFMNVTMIAAQGEDRVPGDSVTRVMIDAIKRYAFIHFRTPEEAEQALDLDGITFRGCRLKLGRAISNNALGAAPANIARPVKPLNIDRLGIIKTQVPDGPHKIFVGSLPQSLTDDQVKELLQTYGPLRAFFMFKDFNTGLSRGYAFAQYRDPSVTQAAIRGLNGIKIGDRNLQVSLHDPSLSSQTQTAPTLADLGLQAVPSQGETKCLCLLQMVTKEDLMDDNEYNEILEDIREECGNYGAVRDIVIPKPGNQACGKVFVAFTEVESARKGKAALEGRQFMSRTVLVTFFNEEKFDKREF